MTTTAVAAGKTAMPPITALDSNTLPEVLHLELLSEDSLFTWNWPAVAKRVYEEKTVLISSNPCVYHALRRCLRTWPKPASRKILRRKHPEGYVYQIADVKSPVAPITTRSGYPIQTSNHGLIQKMATELVELGGKPAGYLLELESYGAAHTVRTFFYRLRKRKRAKVEIQMRVKQRDGSFLPLALAPNYQEGQRVAIFASPAET